MRDYGKVYTSFWASHTIRSMSEDGRMLAIYLLTSQHSTLAGVFRLPDGYACEDLQWDCDRLHMALRELSSHGFALRCEATKWVWIVKYLIWNDPENPNQRTAAAKLASQIPDCCTWKSEFVLRYGPIIGTTKTDARDDDPSGTLPEPLLKSFETRSRSSNRKEIHCAVPSDPHDDQLPPKNHTSTPSVRQDAITVLEFLNLKANRAFRASECNLKFITCRLRDGASVIDLKQVIVRKCTQWLHDDKMRPYLRPATLFNREKCEQYLGELVLPD